MLHLIIDINDEDYMILSTRRNVTYQVYYADGDCWNALSTVLHGIFIPQLDTEPETIANYDARHERFHILLSAKTLPALRKQILARPELFI